LNFLGSSLFQDKEEQKGKDRVAVRQQKESQADDSQRNDLTALPVNQSRSHRHYDKKTSIFTLKINHEPRFRQRR